MAQINERDKILMNLYKKSGSLPDFNYDSLQAPPLTKLIPVKDIEYMRNIATSIRYNSKLDFKRQELGKVMNYYGFVEFHSGTHRKVYRHLEVPTICAKLAFNKSSLNDSIAEYHNQIYLKPASTKVFEVDPTGFIGLFERVDPISSKEEFASIAEDVWMLLEILTTMCVVDDVGTDSFMNWGIRKFSNCAGPVLLDFPEVFPIDSDKMYCVRPLDSYGRRCTGEIVYDAGFNTLSCNKCGCPYSARELKRAVDNHDVIMKGWSKNMKILVKRGDTVVDVIDNQVTDKIEPPKKEFKDPLGMNIGTNIRFNPKTKKKKKQQQKNNSNAKFYGTTDKSATTKVGDKMPDAYDRNDVFMKRYRCECGHYYGKNHEGFVCRYCNTKVEYRDDNPKEIKYSVSDGLDMNYRCDCGKTYGKEKNGSRCDTCHTEVVDRRPKEKPVENETPDYRYRCACGETFGEEKKGSFCKKCYTRVVFHDEPKEEPNPWVDNAMNEPEDYKVKTEEKEDWKDMAIDPEEVEENPTEAKSEGVPLPDNSYTLTDEQQEMCDKMLKMWKENTQPIEIEEEKEEEREITVYSDSEQQEAPTLGDIMGDIKLDDEVEEEDDKAEKEAVSFSTQSPLLSNGEGNAFYNL